MTEEGGGMTRRRGSSPAAPVSLPDDDDLLREILLRLPPQPSSLVRASAVCKRWRRLATDPKFLQCFRAHHRKPPLLGYFGYGKNGYGDKWIEFRSILDPPDRIPSERFSLRNGSRRRRRCPENQLLACRHGRVLFNCPPREEVVVWEPISGEQRRVAVPPEFKRAVVEGFLNGSVLCAAGDQGHVHGGCHSSPFTVVLVSMCAADNRPFACVYSSETGVWGNLIATPAPCDLFNFGIPGTLVGNALYWLHKDDGILEFDVDRQGLSMIRGPPVTDNIDDDSTYHIIQAEDGAVGLVVFSYPSMQIWHRKVNYHGVATWLLRKTVDMHNILGLPTQIEGWVGGAILGYVEDTDVIFIYIIPNYYMVQLKSMQFKKLHGIDNITYCYPFTSFYTPGDCSSLLPNPYIVGVTQSS